MLEANCPRCGYENKFQCPNCGSMELGTKYATARDYVQCGHCNAAYSSLSCGNTRYCNAHIMASKMHGYGAGQEMCFIATEIYGAESAEVAALRQFRDRSLLTKRIGILFVRAYYFSSPSIIALMRRSSLARYVVARLVKVAVALGRHANRK